MLYPLRLTFSSFFFASSALSRPRALFLLNLPPSCLPLQRRVRPKNAAAATLDRLWPASVSSCSHSKSNITYRLPG